MNEDRKYAIYIAGRNEPVYGQWATSLQQSLAEQGLMIRADCGGQGTCGKCWVELLQGEVKGPQEIVTAGMPARYLACKTYPRSDIQLRLPEAGAADKGDLPAVFAQAAWPLLRKILLQPQYPNLDNHYSLQQTVLQGLTDAGVNTVGLAVDRLDVLRQLGQLGDSQPAAMTAVLCGEAVIALEDGDTRNRFYGVAFDIGTTTVAGMLVNLSDQTLLAVGTRTNPQTSYGADVISRIQAARELPDGLTALARAIRQCLNEIIAELCAQAEIATAEIYGASLVGNATMIQLLLELSPVNLVRQPYAALFNQLARLRPDQLGLGIHPGGMVQILPHIASFIGSDTTAAVLAVDQDVLPGPSLMVDLGTNGEMVISDGQRLYACSTAAGPAFEGAHIRDGMRAVAGAITSVTIGDDVVLDVIGGGAATGICGSGMIKAIAAMLKKGILHPNGRFDRDRVAALPPALASRLRQRQGQWEYVLSGADEANEIAIIQSDVRQIQLVKASICTGIQFLLEKAGLQADIPLYLAGAFGNCVDLESALEIGMLPGFSRERIHSAGNAAGLGAVQALLDQAVWQRGQAIAPRMEYLELAVQPEFQQRFLANLALMP